MIFLLLSVLLSSTLFLCFKWFDTKNIRLLPAISGNYIACIVIGLLMNKHFTAINYSLAGYSLMLGILFFLTFYAMGFASARIGVGICSAASKLSLIIPVIFGALILKEQLSLMRISALLLAIPAVLLMSYKKDEKLQLQSLGVIIFIFLGSGIIDTSLNLLQEELGNAPSAPYIILIFFSAFCCSLIAFKVHKISLKNEYRSISLGLLLGLPNYFSIHFMILALASGEFTSGEFYLINNSAVILLSFILARLFFSEKINLVKGIGLILSILAIFLALQ